MNHSIWATLIGACWIIFVLYWIAASGFVKKTASEDSRAVRLLQVALLVPAALLLFNPITRVGFLGRRFVPDTAWMAALGTLFTACGIGLAIWARYHIGQNWSSKVMLKTDHTLIQTGPYAVMRHPIYSGLLLAFFGTALARGEWRGLVAVMLILLSHSWKALREEALMRTAFGSEYDDYRKHTGFIFPRLGSAK